MAQASITACDFIYNSFRKDYLIVYSTVRHKSPSGLQDESRHDLPAYVELGFAHSRFMHHFYQDDAAVHAPDDARDVDRFRVVRGAEMRVGGSQIRAEVGDDPNGAACGLVPDLEPGRHVVHAGELGNMLFGIESELFLAGRLALTDSELNADGTARIGNNRISIYLGVQLPGVGIAEGKEASVILPPGSVLCQVETRQDDK
jgi:hypothetical protein